jgi:hypothetical protein
MWEGVGFSDLLNGEGIREVHHSDLSSLFPVVRRANMSKTGENNESND